MNEFKDLMVKAIALEWESFVKYAIHASLIKTMGKSARADHLEEHADEEKDHAERLTMHMLSRGQPFEINFSCSIPSNQLSGDVVSILIDDLRGEIEIIELYLNIIEIIENEDNLRDTKIFIEDIITDEIEHQDDLTMMIINRLKGNQNAADPDEPIEKQSRINTINKLIKCANKMDNIGMNKEATVLDNFIQEFVKDLL